MMHQSQRRAWSLVLAGSSSTFTRSGMRFNSSGGSSSSGGGGGRELGPLGGEGGSTGGEPQLQPQKASTKPQLVRLVETAVEEGVDEHGQQLYPMPEQPLHSPDQTGKDQLPMPRMENSPMAAASIQYDATVPYTREDELVELKEALERGKIARTNAAIKSPLHPSNLVPTYRRISKNAKMVKKLKDDVYNSIIRLEHGPKRPLPPEHPYVRNQPIGPNIVHGDGWQQIVGHNDVGFDNDPKDTPVAGWPKHWKGFKHHSTANKRPPQRHGAIHPDMKVKQSVQLTGKGYFATKDIKQGEHIMVVHSETVSLGYEAETTRLVLMCIDILNNTLAEDDQARSDGTGSEAERTEFNAEYAARLDFLHQWIMTNQPSSIMDRFPQDAVDRVVEGIGGIDNLSKIQLHRNHICRLAAAIEMNAFLVESYFGERKGMAYFPEASLFNHSCCPNIDYDIIPSHLYEESSYYKKRQAAAVATEVMEEEEPEEEPELAEGEDSTTKRNMAELQADMEEVPVYLFCCQANRDIKAGEEMLISYVPTNWRTDDRQHVLHDRYRFYCKCPKCVVMIEYFYGWHARWGVFVIVFYLAVNMMAGYITTDGKLRWTSAVAAGDDLVHGDTPKGGNWQAKLYKT